MDNLQMINKIKNTYIADDIIEMCFKISNLTPNVFINVAHKICDKNDLKNPARVEVIKDARTYLKANHCCYSQI